MVDMRTRQFNLYISVPRVRVWQALTDPAMTRRFYFGLAVESDWCAGSTIVYSTTLDPGTATNRPVAVVLTGEIVDIEPGHRLVHSLLTDTDTDRETQSWVSWELDEPEPGVCRVSLTCDDLDRFDDPERDEAWCRVLSGLKTVLETAKGGGDGLPE
jgi:uncharacterized protein YndB with AHSA1/START domain